MQAAVAPIWALEDLGRANSLQDVHGVCARFAESLGFTYFIYAFRSMGEFNQARMVYVNGYPPGWTERYFAGGYQDIDPVMQHCRQRVTPVIWAELSVHRPEEVAMMADATSFGLTDGLTVPVHAPTGELGVLSLATRATNVGACTWLDALRDAMVVAPHVHEAIGRVAPKDGESVVQTLTDRETEALRWAAVGKTSWEMARLMVISERTINFHLNNAVYKLNASNRQHAVAKAIARGILTPRPF